MAPLLPGEGAPAPGRCTSLALVTDRRGLTALDGRRATPLDNLEQALLWLNALRSSGCQFLIRALPGAVARLKQR